MMLVMAFLTLLTSMQPQRTSKCKSAEAWSLEEASSCIFRQNLNLALPSIYYGGLSPDRSTRQHLPGQWGQWGG